MSPARAAGSRAPSSCSPGCCSSSSRRSPATCGWRSSTPSVREPRDRDAEGSERPRDLVAERVTDQVVLRSRSELLARGRSSSARRRGSWAAARSAALFHRAALDVHRAVFDRDQNTISLTLVGRRDGRGRGAQSFRAPARRPGRGGPGRALLRERVGGTGDIARIGHRSGPGAPARRPDARRGGGRARAARDDRRRTASSSGWRRSPPVSWSSWRTSSAQSHRARALRRPRGAGGRGCRVAGFLGDLRALGLVVAGAGAIVGGGRGVADRPRHVRAPVAGVALVGDRAAAALAARAARRRLIAAGVLVVAEPSTALTVAACSRASCSSRGRRDPAAPRVPAARPRSRARGPRARAAAAADGRAARRRSW